MLNKWDYRYPHFGLQKLHMGYGYGYPIYPQVSKHKDFMSLVNRLENRMTNIEDNVSNISQDVVDELHVLLQQFNEIDTIISVDDVQLIVESAIDNIEYPEYITIDVVKNEITQAINEIDLGLSALEVQAMISESIDELDVGLGEAQVMVLIHESLAMIDTGLNYTQVQDLITLTLANLDVGMTEDDVTDLIQFHVQAIPIDSIQSEIASLRATVETLDVPDVDLSDVYSRLLLIESQLGNVDNYDDEWIHTEIQLLNDLIQGIETGDVDLSGVLSRLNALESKVDNDTIYDDGWIHTEIQSLRDLINAVETGEVNLTEVHSRLDVLESKVDNDTIYDDSELRNLIVQLREDLDNIEVGDGESVDLESIITRIEEIELLLQDIETLDSEYVDSEIEQLREDIIGVEHDIDYTTVINSNMDDILLEEVEDIYMTVDFNRRRIRIDITGIPTTFTSMDEIPFNLRATEFYNGIEHGSPSNFSFSQTYYRGEEIYVDLELYTRYQPYIDYGDYPPIEELRSLKFESLDDLFTLEFTDMYIYPYIMNTPPLGQVHKNIVDLQNRVIYDFEDRLGTIEQTVSTFENRLSDIEYRLDNP